MLTGVSLFSVDTRQLGVVAERARLELALLPDRVRAAANTDADDDF